MYAEIKRVPFRHNAKAWGCLPNRHCLQHPYHWAICYSSRLLRLRRILRLAAAGAAHSPWLKTYYAS